MRTPSSASPRFAHFQGSDLELYLVPADSPAARLGRERFHKQGVEESTKRLPDEVIPYAPYSPPTDEDDPEEDRSLLPEL